MKRMGVGCWVMIMMRGVVMVMVLMDGMSESDVISDVMDGDIDGVV
jgi:hypothetical protein